MKKIFFMLFIINLTILFAKNDELTNDFIKFTQTSSPTPLYLNQTQQNHKANENKKVYVDTFAMQTIINNYNNNNKVQTAKMVNLINKNNNTNINIAKNNLNQYEYKKNKAVYNNFYLTGFCVVPNKVSISRLSATVVLNCNFSNNLNGKLTALFVPDLYSKALIAKPLYITFNKNPNKRYFVLGGILMNATQTSLNIASIINDRKIEQFLAKEGIDSANIVTKNAMAYLQERIKSRQQTSVTYMKDENGNIVPIQQQQIQKPKITDYIAVSALQLLSNIVSNVSNIFYENLPYLFLVKKNTMLYADLYLTDKPQGLPSFAIPTNNIVVKNPPYSKEQPSQIILQPIKANK